MRLCSDEKVRGGQWTGTSMAAMLHCKVKGQRLPKIVKEGYRLPHNSHSGEARAFPDVGSVTMYVT